MLAGFFVGGTYLDAALVNWCPTLTVSEGEAMSLSPKQELVVTLEAAWKLLDGAEPPAVRLAQIRGLVDHARALAQRVGNEARAPKKGRPTVTISPESMASLREQRP